MDLPVFRGRDAANLRRSIQRCGFILDIHDARLRHAYRWSRLRVYEAFNAENQLKLDQLRKSCMQHLI
jgi:hypothetical protein